MAASIIIEQRPHATQPRYPHDVGHEQPSESEWVGAYEYSRHAKSQCRPSSREMSSLEKVSPCIRPRFLSQKMEQKEPEKKMPSTHAHATSRSAKDDSLPGQHGCQARSTP